MTADWLWLSIYVAGPVLMVLIMLEVTARALGWQPQLRTSWLNAKRAFLHQIWSGAYQAGYVDGFEAARHHFEPELTASRRRACETEQWMERSNYEAYRLGLGMGYQFALKYQLHPDQPMSAERLN